MIIGWSLPRNARKWHAFDTDDPNGGSFCGEHKDLYRYVSAERLIIIGDKFFNGERCKTCEKRAARKR